MDGQQFDQLARVFASGTTRRKVLGLVATGIAGLTAQFTGNGARAGGCEPIGNDCNDDNLVCCGGLICVQGLCEQQCGASGDSCFLPSDVNQSGGFVCCEDGLECIDGTCLTPEPVCSDEGGSCAGGRFPDCCNGDLQCVDGTCQFPEPFCSEVGGPCDGNKAPDCCVQGLICVEGVCEEPAPICAEIGESCGQLDGAIQVDCCDDLLCIDGLCEEPEPKCIVLGGQCAETADCCEGECSDAGICEIIEDTCLDEGVACEADSECCEGICCAGFCRAIECCIDEPNPNDRCPEGTSCFEGICEGVAEFCEDDSTCGTGTCCCDDGSCSEDCCDPPVEDDDEPVTELPNTGVGGDATRSATWIGAAAIGAAMAFLGGKKLKPQESTADSEPTVNRSFNRKSEHTTGRGNGFVPLFRLAMRPPFQQIKNLYKIRHIHYGSTTLG